MTEAPGGGAPAAHTVPGGDGSDALAAAAPDAPAAPGSPAAPAPAPRTPFTTAVERYLRHVTVERGLSVNTVAAYRRDLTRYAAFLAAHGVDAPAAVTAKHVSAFSEHLRSDGDTPLTASSTARMLSSVRTFTRYLQEEGLVEDDVAADVRPPKLPSRLPKAITIEQMERLLAATEGDTPQALRDRALLELLYATGARISEIVGLNVDDVLTGDVGAAASGSAGAPENTPGRATGAEPSVGRTAAAANTEPDASAAGFPGTAAAEAAAAGTGPGAVGESDDRRTGDMIRVVGKGDKQRIVPVGSYARAALDAYLVRVRPGMSARGRATPALFLGIRGQRMSRQNAWLIIRAAAERAKLGIEISPHTFRHSFATHLLAGGADVRVVQELLGHSSVATTQIYTLVTADTLRDMYTTAHPRAR